VDTADTPVFQAIAPFPVIQAIAASPVTPPYLAIRAIPDQVLQVIPGTLASRGIPQPQDTVAIQASVDTVPFPDTQV
jgi:hypothetical protein